MERNIAIVGGGKIERADRHPVAVYLSRLAAGGSRRSALGALNRVARILGGDGVDARSFPWSELRYPHVSLVREKLVESGAAPATVNHSLSIVRGIAEECFRLEVMSSEDYTRIRLVKSVRGSREAAGRAVSAEEIGALFSACDATTSIGVRDAAILAIAYGGGLRRAEIVGLDLESYDRASKRFRVIGKGNKERFLHLSRGVSAHVDRWIGVRGEGNGPFFLSIDRFGRLAREGITPQAILVIVRRIAKKAGVSHFSPHDLRRTFVTDLLDRGNDIGAVQRAAGHANVSTTLRYDRRGEIAVSAALETLSIPKP